MMSSKVTTSGRRPKMHPGISIDLRVMFGKSVIRGTRITVEIILRKLAAGQTLNEILASHPNLARENILAAIAFAAEQHGDDGFGLTTANVR